jgi:hypothetical protein
VGRAREQKQRGHGNWRGSTRTVEAVGRRSLRSGAAEGVGEYSRRGSFAASASVVVGCGVEMRCGSGM